MGLGVFVDLSFLAVFNYVLSEFDADFGSFVGPEHRADLFVVGKNHGFVFLEEVATNVHFVFVVMLFLVRSSKGSENNLASRDLSSSELEYSLM